jgi:hypothetical protein
MTSRREFLGLLAVPLWPVAEARASTIALQAIVVYTRQ